MAEFISNVEAEHLVRPLLIATGAAATAAGIYLYVKRHDVQETTSDSEVTTASKDPVCKQASEPTVQPREVLQTKAVAEAKIRALTVSNTQLEGRLKELEEQLCEALRDCDVKTKEYKQEQISCTILNFKYNEMKRAIAWLKMENDEISKTLMHREDELLKAEEQHQKDVEIIAQLDEENSNLTKQVKKLNNTVQAYSILQVENDEMKKILIHQQELLKECELKQEAHSIPHKLEVDNDETKKTLAQKVENLLKVSLAEAEKEHQKTITQLEEEKSNLKKQVEELNNTVQHMGNKLIESHRAFDELRNYNEMKETITQLEVDKNDMKKTLEDLLKKHQQEQEINIILQTEKDEMKKLLIQQLELLKVSQAEAQNEQAIAQLVEEKSNLTKQVENLNNTLQVMSNKLFESHRQYGELKSESEQKQEAHSILQFECNVRKENIAQLEVDNNDMKMTLEELLEERQQEQEAHSIFQAENNEMKKTLLQQHELLKVSQTEAEEERTNLTKQCDKLNNTVQDMGNKLFESHKEYDKLLNECEQKQKTHSILQFEYNEMKKTIAQLEVENNDMKLKVEDLLKEGEQKQEAHNILQCEYNEMKQTITQLEVGNDELQKTLSHKQEEYLKESQVHSVLQAENDQQQELLKLSLAEIEKKHENTVKIIDQLEHEKNILKEQMENLKNTMKNMEHKHLKSHREYQEKTINHQKEQETHRILQLEYEEMKKTITQLTVKNDDMKKAALMRESHSEQETHSILQAENDEMKKTLIHQQELLKVSLAEAEKENEKVVQNIAKLKQEKFVLKKLVEKLNNTVEDMGSKVFESERKYDKLRKKCDKKQETHGILQFEYDEMKETIAKLEVEKDEMKKSLEELHRKELLENFKCTMEMKKTLARNEEELLKVNLKHQQDEEAHAILQAENNEMKETLIQQQELMKVSLTEAEEEHQKVGLIIDQLEEEQSNLIKQVEKLSNTVEDMGKQFSESNRQYDQLRKTANYQECEQEQEAHSILQFEYNKMKETIAQLEVENNNMKTLEELLKVSLAEAEKEHQTLLKNIDHLEEEKSIMTKQVDKLNNTVQDMGNKLLDFYKEYDEIINDCEQKQDTHNILQFEYNEMKNTIAQLRLENDDMKIILKHKEEELLEELEQEREAHGILQLETDEMKMILIQQQELLKVSLAEAEEEHQKLSQTIAQLEEEKCNLIKQVDKLNNTVQGNKLFESHREYDKLTNECEQNQEAHCTLQLEYNEISQTITQLETLPDKEHQQEQKVHSILQAENDEMKKTLIHQQELLKVSLVESEKEHQKVSQTIAQLEEEKSKLTKQVEKLNSTIQDMDNKLSGRQREYDSLQNECEENQETRSILQFEYNEMKKAIAQLEVENHDMKKTLSYREEELLKEHQHEQGAHSILQGKNDEMDKTLIHQQELLKVSQAKAEEEHQKLVQILTQLEEEKSNLTEQMEKLNSTVQDMGNNLLERYREYVELRNEREREWQAESVLQAEIEKLKKTLIQQEEVLKVFLAQSENEHQKFVEIITQMEEEKSNLAIQIGKLNSTMQDMGNKLLESQKQHDELTNKCEQEQEAHISHQIEYNEMKEATALLVVQNDRIKKTLLLTEEELMKHEEERKVHNILRAENEEMKKTLIHKEKFLKFSLAKAEDQHQQAVETIAQLESKFNEMMMVYGQEVLKKYS